MFTVKECIQWVFSFLAVHNGMQDRHLLNKSVIKSKLNEFVENDLDQMT
jgi:hypothetical protein